MTRKDYVLLAGALQVASERLGRLNDPSNLGMVGFEVTEQELCIALAKDNPKFDREHFLAVVRGEKSLESKPVRKTDNPKFDRVRKLLLANKIEVEADFSVRNEGSIFLFTPYTPEAKAWVKEHLPEDAQWFGFSFAVEHRYAQDIVEGIKADGLTVE